MCMFFFPVLIILNIVFWRTEIGLTKERNIVFVRNLLNVVRESLGFVKAYCVEKSVFFKGLLLL